MKTKLLISLGVLALLMCFTSLGQNSGNNEENIWLQQLVREYSYNVVLQNDLNNKAYVIQNGSGNNAIVNQKITGNRYQSNVLYMIQQGNNNNGLVKQVGLGNEYNIYQFGSDNDLDLMTEGKRNKSTLFQIGNSNKIKQRLRGNEMDYFILQEGIRNELIHIENGVKHPEYRIEQKGTGMKLIIENSNIYRK
ncbi:MAG: hypothetical protein IMY70_01980 [Bacteroidetes bacterium]|nr:hypothetical protein [Bacteroidota bacterium]